MTNHSDKDPLQSAGRKANAAHPLNKMGGEKGGPERYPPARADEALEGRPGEGRSFEPKVRNQTAPDKADAQGPSGETRRGEPDDLRGPAGDPAEGRR